MPGAPPASTPRAAAQQEPRGPAETPDALFETHLTGLGEPSRGKVRDNYVVGGRRIMVATDRVSAFGRTLGTVPHKGRVLTELTAWWVERLADIVPHHAQAVPHPNVIVATDARALPVEVVVRGHIAGDGPTSLWALYARGMHMTYGIALPPGLRRHDRLPHPLVTPTTKAPAGLGDQPLTGQQVVERGLVAPALWREICQRAVMLYARGRRLADEVGLVMLDTKYEFGLVSDDLVLIDEVHTPDSSRFLDRASGDGEPVFLCKEYLRRHCSGDDGADRVALPSPLRAEASRRYRETHHRLTGRCLDPTETVNEDAISRAVDPWRAVPQYGETTMAPRAERRG